MGTKARDLPTSAKQGNAFRILKCLCDAGVIEHWIAEWTHE